MNGKEEGNFETEFDISLDNRDNKEDGQCCEEGSGDKSNTKSFIDPDKDGIQKQADWVAIALSDDVEQSNKINQYFFQFDKNTCGTTRWRKQ